MDEPLVARLLDPLVDLAAAHPVALGLVAFLLPILALVAYELVVGRRGAPAPAQPLPPPAPLEEPATTLAPASTEPAVAPAPEAPAEPVRPAPPPEIPVPAEPVPPALPPEVPVAAEPEPAPVPEPPQPVRLRDRLARTSEALVGRLDRMLSGRRVDAELLEEIEALLFTADLGVATAESLLDHVRKQAGGGDADRVRKVLREAIAAKLKPVEPPAGSSLAITARPHVILVLGVNGSGKTTTIGKLAARFREAGRSVVLGAGDTFRAAAIEQLEAWGERVGCEVVTGRPGGDPSAVAFDTVKAATARGIDVAIIDTAGRLQTKQPLIEELRKIVRVIGRELPGAPHETLLVLDSNTGQNAISQARIFTEAAGVTALALTKLDGTAKGGVLVGLADEFGIPVRYVGVGEGVEDLQDFSAEEFVEALFEREGGRT